MKKILGITTLLVLVCVITAAVNQNFLGAYNVGNVVKWTSLFAILGIGAAFVIITGGIDLSIGSVVGLVGTLLPWLLVKKGWSVPVALGAGVSLSVLIGLFHGVLITKVRLQPFVVTLCGLLMYRGIARTLTHDQDQGFEGKFDSLRWLATGRVQLPNDYWLPIPFFIMIGIAIVAAIFLNKTVWGRHLLALGRNEDAARYSGIRTDRMIILAYVLCAFLSGLGGILFALELNTVQPAGHGNFYELYAIAAAVLGGCSLRGGEGSILGVLIGAAVMRVLSNSIGVLGQASQMEFAIIGVVILLGVTADELLRRRRKV
ncbi:monosaccharide ABC transporter membrane protein (CUT2 family) [Roseimicrobium gellanilyticum]|uniref:Monosaccharide ABC transporter membrane protein (CUT2 family) n=1 Tax=Roseimicrobium gellanilyticum TaxID=748857 RepID=A0A366HTT6_9BACT|nr:ABC transporter permease [Roseimicrobium gellanilyticum]RBP46343.1 monosaccharide ABC transporter membrane protein (CUT2 family) [Roseimicrobium gellanilyticum]